MKEIAYSATATIQLRKLSPAVRSRILAKLQAYAAGGSGDVTRLKGRPGSRLRVGDWRVIFTETEAVVTVLEAGHRREIYD